MCVDLLKVLTRLASKLRVPQLLLDLMGSCGHIRPSFALVKQRPGLSASLAMTGYRIVLAPQCWPYICTT